MAYKFSRKDVPLKPFPQYTLENVTQALKASKLLKEFRLLQTILIKHKTIDTPKMVNIFILYVSTSHLSHLQKNEHLSHSSEDDLNVKLKRKE